MSEANCVRVNFTRSTVKNQRVRTRAVKPRLNSPVGRVNSTSKGDVRPLLDGLIGRTLEPMNSSRRQFLARTAAGAVVLAGGSFSATTATASGPVKSGGQLTALVNATVIDVATGRRN